MTVDIGPDFALCYQDRCFHSLHPVEKRRRVRENEKKNENGKEGIEGRKEDIKDGKKTLFGLVFCLKIDAHNPRTSVVCAVCILQQDSGFSRKK
jgi:superfamily II RNA helicase